MSGLNDRGGWQARLAQACGRLLNPHVCEKDADKQRRLAGQLLFAPLILGVLAVPYLLFTIELPLVLASLCITIAAFWAVLAMQTLSGRLGFAAVAGLLLAVCAFVAVTSLAGGLSSPLALIWISLPIEAWWTVRNRRAAQVGACASMIGIATCVAGSVIVPLPLAEVSAWHWLMPLGYAVTVFLRRSSFVRAVPQTVPGDEPLDAMLDCAVLRIDSDNEICSANAQVEDAFGLKPDMLLGATLFERLHVADRVAYMRALADLRETGIMQRLELRLRVAGPSHATSLHWFAVTMMLRANGEIVILLRDQQAMADLQRTARLATERADRLAATQAQALATVSHELRTPLNAIIGFSDMMAQGLVGRFSNPRQAEYIGVIHESGRHLLSVVDTVLDASKIEQGHYQLDPEPFRFGEAMEFCRSMLEMQAQEKGVSLRIKLESNLGDLCADRRAVQQTLINLVGNAIKFTPSGGAVTIGAHRQGRNLQFWVSDTGIGIAASDLDRVGRPFVQLGKGNSERCDGAGLGLSIVKGLVALHDGKMNVASKPGEGTTITITLPVDGPVQTPMTGEREWTKDHGTQDAETYRKSA